MAVSRIGSGGAAIFAAFGACAILIGGALTIVVLRDRDGPPVERAEVAEPVGLSAPSDAERMPEAEPASRTTPGRRDTPRPPEIDVVRVDAAGGTLVAGRTRPGETVAILVDGGEMAQAQADAAGAFVTFLTLPPSAQPRSLTLQAQGADGVAVAGEETVLVAPFGTGTAPDATPSPEPLRSPQHSAQDAAPGSDAASVARMPSPSPARQGSDSASDAGARVSRLSAEADASRDLAVDQAAQPASETPPQALAATPGGTPPVAGPVENALAPLADPSPFPDAEPGRPAAPGQPSDAPTIIIANAEGVRVLQAPGAAPGAQDVVRLDTISYDAEGAVTLAGRGPTAARLRVLLDDAPVRAGAVGPDGDWRLDLPGVAPGTYTLRVEQLDAEGRVLARVETPFLREDPARVAQGSMRAADGASVITVQPGFTLWGIAEENFGSGVLYVSIFNQNRADIADPDLIFPGQIFALPDLPRADPAP